MLELYCWRLSSWLICSWDPIYGHGLTLIAAFIYCCDSLISNICFGKMIMDSNKTGFMSGFTLWHINYVNHVNSNRLITFHIKSELSMSRECWMNKGMSYTVNQLRVWNRQLYLVKSIYCDEKATQRNCDDSWPLNPYPYNVIHAYSCHKNLGVLNSFQEI